MCREMIHSALQILWLALPISSWVANLFLPRRLHFVLLFVLVCFGGYILLVASVFAYDAYLETELYEYDLNGDRRFEDAELTPAAQRAMDNLTNDTGRQFAPVTAVPITGLWVMLNFSVLYFGKWCCRCFVRIEPRKPLYLGGSKPSSDSSRDTNPYRPLSASKK